MLACPDPNCNYKIDSNANLSAEIAELVLGKHVLHDHPWPFASGPKKGDHEVPQFTFKNRDDLKLWLKESNPDEIKQWLDDKWEIKTPDKNLQDTDFCVKFDFRNPNAPGKAEVDILYWIDFMIILDKFEQHRQLLRHPLFTALLYSQKRINERIYRLMLLYKWSFAYCSMIMVLFFANFHFFGKSHIDAYDKEQVEDISFSNWTKCNNSSDIYYVRIENIFDKSSTTGGVNKFVFVSIIVSTVILILKQAIHLFTAIWHSYKEFRKYGRGILKNLEIWNFFKTLEYWLEGLYIYLSIILISEVFYPNLFLSRCEGIQLRGVVATMVLIRCIVCLELLLQYFEGTGCDKFLKALGVKRTLGVIRTAFKKIFWNCLSILCFIIPYTASFGLFFYIALHNDYGTKEKNTANPQIQRNIMSDYGNTYLKTFVMFIGELDFSSIPFENAPRFSYLVFIVFLLVIIVLMNLLTGLAVEDMEGIEQEADLRAQMNRAWFIRGLLKTYPFMLSSFWAKTDGHWTKIGVRGKLKKSLNNFMNKKNIKELKNIQELYLEHDLVKDSIKNYCTTITQRLAATPNAQQAINVPPAPDTRGF